MERLLIVGHGDVSRRMLDRLPDCVRVRLIGRRLGADLDRPESLLEFAGWADRVLYTAPPPPSGIGDPRMTNLLRMLAEGSLPDRIVYIGTSGVYGDCGGAWVDESRPVAPATQRAMRRGDAERQLEAWSEHHGRALVILRAPGIYAADRLPLATLRARAPVIVPEEDVYTNHIHADDLASIALRALHGEAPSGIYNASDDSEIRLGDWYDLIADRQGLPRPPRLSRREAESRIRPERWSYMTESRRLVNRKLKSQLGVRLIFPTVHDGIPKQLAAGCV